jgi:hypothetical protein
MTSFIIAALCAWPILSVLAGLLIGRFIAIGNPTQETETQITMRRSKTASTDPERERLAA